MASSYRDTSHDASYTTPFHLLSARVDGEEFGTVDIYFPTIHIFLYGGDTDATRTHIFPDIYYGWMFVKDGNFDRERALRRTTKKLIAQNILADGEGDDWVMVLKKVIKKANLTFTDKFLWLLVHH